MECFYTVDSGDVLEAHTTIDTLSADSHEIREVEGFYSSDEARARLGEMFDDGLSNYGLFSLIGRHPSYFAQEENGYRVPVAVNGETAYELTFELIRRLHYPHAVSRFQALFGSRSIVEAKAFRDVYRSADKPIYEVRSPKYTIHDMELLKLGVNGIGGYELAHRYWSGEQANNPTWEVLMRLPVAIGDRVD